MTRDQKTSVEMLRQQGVSYPAIAERLGVSVGAVKMYCHRNSLQDHKSEQKTQTDPDKCPQCGKPLNQQIGTKPKRFCCDACRFAWWAAHRDQLKRKAVTQYVCAYCKESFVGYTAQPRKYCGHQCYISDRFGGSQQHDQRAI